MKTKNSTHAGTAARRKEIIQAALACFTELGFTHTGMADIRRRSKASTGSIYHHFKSKEQLAAEVYIEGIRDYQEGFVSALEEQEHARDGIFAVVNYHLKWVEKNPDWTVYLFQKRYAEFMGSTEGEVERLNMEFTSHCAKWFSKQVRAGKLRRLPADLYGAILIGPCMEYSRLYLSGQARTPIDQAILEFASIAWGSLGVKLQDE